MKKRNLLDKIELLEYKGFIIRKMNENKHNPALTEEYKKQLQHIQFKLKGVI